MEHQTQNAEDAANAPACEVFFDGDCPLCQAEIGMYQRQRADARFTDVSTGAGAPPEISPQAALKRFHVRRGDGVLVSGAAAFAELWKATPGWRWLGHIAAVPPFVWIGEGLYRAFLVFRPGLQKLARSRQPG